VGLPKRISVEAFKELNAVGLDCCQVTIHFYLRSGAGSSIRRQPYSCYMVQFDDVLFVNNNNRSQFCELKCSL